MWAPVRRTAANSAVSPMVSPAIAEAPIQPTAAGGAAASILNPPVKAAVTASRAVATEPLSRLTAWAPWRAIAGRNHTTADAHRAAAVRAAASPASSCMGWGV